MILVTEIIQFCKLVLHRMFIQFGFSLFIFLYIVYIRLTPYTLCGCHRSCNIRQGFTCSYIVYLL